MTAETIHTCSYSCDRPECIRAQRDELAARLNTPPSAPVGVEDVVMAARNAENAIRNCAAAGQIGEGYVQYADDLRDAVQRLAQQPAPSALVGAEDIEVLKRLREALHDAAMNGWWLAVKVLDRVIAALAAQHQEPKP